jgi:hypothetical protein
MKSRILAMMLVLAAAGVSAKPALLEHVPLKWKPTSKLQLGTMQMAVTAIQFETFTDLRTNKEAIGENSENDTPKPVTTTDDVGAFVSIHMRELFDKAGLKTVDSGGAVTVKGEIKQLFVRETSTYQSNAVVHLSVTGSDGKTLWTGIVQGDATRFGRSYQLENYYEVLSDAIVNTVSSMLGSAEFQKALSAR